MSDQTIRARDCLLADGVVLLPTDTVYGLAVHPESETAATRLFAMKNRPRVRNLPIMVGSVDDLSALGVQLTEPARRLFGAFAPGALTVALGLRPGAAPGWLAGRDEVGVRIPADEDILAVLALTGPLLVTSANAHGQDTRETVPEILAALHGRPDLVIDGGARPVVPSTLVNCNLPEPAIERHGVIGDDDIYRVLSGVLS